jgi:hypothetical protein
MAKYSKAKAKLIKKISSNPNKMGVRGKPTKWESSVPTLLMKSGILNDDEYKMKVG